MRYRNSKIILPHLPTNKPEDSNWVVLPVSSFNNYFSSTVFSKQVLKSVTGTVIERSDMSYGSGRYRVLEAFL